MSCGLGPRRHDAHRARQFRELSASPPTALLRADAEVLRIYDIEEIDGNLSANAHVYGSNRQSLIEHDMALCVWNGHMRCFSQLPSQRWGDGKRGRIMLVRRSTTHGKDGHRT